MPKANGKITEEHRDENGKFLPGNPGGGRPAGSVNFATKWKKFIEKVAESNNTDFDATEQQLLAIAYKKAREGDYQFYRDIFDRVYGKPQQTFDHKNDGGAFPTPIMSIDGLQRNDSNEEDQDAE